MTAMPVPLVTNALMGPANQVKTSANVPPMMTALGLRTETFVMAH
jgi:hypothetical protein